MTTDEQSSEVLVEASDGILTITINRPAAKNAMTLYAATRIAAALDDLDSRDDLRIGILTGAGGTFCAGMDLKGFLRGERPSLPGRGFGGLTRKPPSKPLIAAVEGYALAGGFELVLACDLVVASETAQFGVPEVKRGLAEVLKREGYIWDWAEVDSAPANKLRLELKYGPNGERVIRHLKRVSKPGRRVYSRADQLKPVLNGMGICVLSTSRGVISDREARQRKLGGEVLCELW